jgi:hypothetical protein
MPKTKKIPEGMVAVREEDLGTLLLCSMRYAIGRHTYMPSDICRIINEHKDELSEPNRKLLAVNIDSEIAFIQRCDKDPNSLNSKVKREEAVKWFELIENLEKTKE